MSVVEKEEGFFRNEIKSSKASLPCDKSVAARSLALHNRGVEETELEDLGLEFLEGSTRDLLALTPLGDIDEGSVNFSQGAPQGLEGG